MNNAQMEQTGLNLQLTKIMSCRVAKKVMEGRQPYAASRAGAYRGVVKYVISLAQNLKPIFDRETKRDPYTGLTQGESADCRGTDPAGVAMRDPTVGRLH